MNPRDDATELRRRLGDLSAVARAAFAAACAERLRTAYSRSLSAESEWLTRRALDLAWAFSATGGVASAETSECLLSLEASLRPHDEIVDGEAGLREQAILTAVLYALRQCAHEEGDDAFWVARQLTDAIDEQAQSQLEVGLLTTDDERTLETHPGITRETRRQLLDLEEASRAETDAASLSSLRKRAQFADAALERSLGVGSEG